MEKFKWQKYGPACWLLHWCPNFLFQFWGIFLIPNAIIKPHLVSGQCASPESLVHHYGMVPILVLHYAKYRCISCRMSGSESGCFPMVVISYILTISVLCVHFHLSAIVAREQVVVRAIHRLGQFLSCVDRLSKRKCLIDCSFATDWFRMLLFMTNRWTLQSST